MTSATTKASRDALHAKILKALAAGPKSTYEVTLEVCEAYEYPMAVTDIVKVQLNRLVKEGRVAVDRASSHNGGRPNRWYLAPAKSVAS